jgi:Uma2 family endonuclease
VQKGLLPTQLSNLLSYTLSNLFSYQLNMGAALKLPEHYTIEEYREVERTSLFKYEYHNGDLRAMAGGSPQHSLIATNISRELGNSLKKKPCRTYNSDLKIAVARTRFVYPDASVICGKIEPFEEYPEAANNPKVIVEVLSPSTEQYDRGVKFMYYRQLTSLQEYVLIDSTSVLVEVFSKNENNKWELTSYGHLNEDLLLSSLKISIPLSEIYDGVDVVELEL